METIQKAMPGDKPITLGMAAVVTTLMAEKQLEQEGHETGTPRNTERE